MWVTVMDRYRNVITPKLDLLAVLFRLAQPQDYVKEDDTAVPVDIPMTRDWVGCERCMRGRTTATALRPEVPH
jgi:hypothetical protein